MKPEPTTRRFFAPPAAILLAFIVHGRAAAQDVLAPRTPTPVTPPAVQELQAENPYQVFAPTPAEVVRRDDPPFSLGPVGLRPHASYRFLYGEGIAASGSNHVTTTIQEFSPGVLLNLGDHWSLDYSPIWQMYSSKAFRDTFDHNVVLMGGTSYEDWILGLSQSYASSSTPLVETGTQTDQQTFVTAISASYRFNSSLSMDLGASQTTIAAEDQLRSSREWATMDWLNYHVGTGIDLGLGAGVGYLDVSTNSDTMYEQFQGRVAWRATDKVSLQLHGGVEIRQLVGGNRDIVNPVAGAEIQYQPFDVTRLSLSMNRHIAASLLTTNLLTETTELGVALNQRLLEHFYLDLSGSYQKVDYEDKTGESNRQDDLYVFNARLSCEVLRRGSLAVFYQYSDNNSNVEGFTFHSSQVGFEVGYRF